jgi:hypothetical protein
MVTGGISPDPPCPGIPSNRPFFAVNLELSCADFLVELLQLFDWPTIQATRLHDCPKAGAALDARMPI